MLDLTYRNVETRDFDALHAIASHWSVVRQLGGWPWPPDPDFTKTRAKPYQGDGFVWAICKDDRLIGTVAVTGREVGYFLAPAHHGQGIMSAAVDRAVHAGFCDLGRDRLQAYTWADNDASHKVLTRAGFFHYRTDFDHAKARRVPTLGRAYRMFRADWDRLRTAAQ